MKICTLIYARNYIKQTTYYVQEAKTVSENIFKHILKGKTTGKWQIRTRANISKTDNKRLEQHERFYLGKRITQIHNYSLSKKQLILMILNCSDFMRFISCSLLNPYKAMLLEGKFSE